MQAKKEMMRYLSRVHDKNKPLFVFNQKLNTGKNKKRALKNDDSDSLGTPRWSCVSIVLS